MKQRMNSNNNLYGIFTKMLTWFGYVMRMNEDTLPKI